MKSTFTTIQERGILTSAYKKEIKEDIANAKAESICNIKSMIFDHDESIESNAGAILKVAVFAFSIIFIIV